MTSDQQSLSAEQQAAPEGVLARFIGKVAIITGASDRGIGGAIAERLAQEGAAVALFSRNEPKRLLKRLQRAERDMQWIRCDVTAAEDVRQSVAQAMKRFGKIDVLVNNAGVEYARPFEEYTDEQWQYLLDVNLHGAIRLTRTVLPHLSSPGGVIVNVASALALGGCPSFSIYSAGKAGLIGLTQSLAWELAPRKIRAVAIAPALVATPMTLKHLEHLTPKFTRTWKQTIRWVLVCRMMFPAPWHSSLPTTPGGLPASLCRWVGGRTMPYRWNNSWRQMKNCRHRSRANAFSGDASQFA